MWACQTVSIHDLENFSKCWKQWIVESCEPNSTMLGAKLVYDPEIKVVPLIKYYNFALVTTSMQGLLLLVQTGSNMSQLNDDTLQTMA